MWPQIFHKYFKYFPIISNDRFSDFCEKSIVVISVMPAKSCSGTISRKCFVSPKLSNRCHTSPSKLNNTSFPMLSLWRTISSKMVSRSETGTWLLMAFVTSSNELSLKSFSLGDFCCMSRPFAIPANITQQHVSSGQN